MSNIKTWASQQEENSNCYCHFFTNTNVCFIFSIEKSTDTFTFCTISSPTLFSLRLPRLNGNDELKVKDGLPTEIAIDHLHLISHHMVVKTCPTAQVEIFIFIILQVLLSLQHVGHDASLSHMYRPDVHNTYLYFHFHRSSRRIFGTITALGSFVSRSLH